MNSKLITAAAAITLATLTAQTTLAQAMPQPSFHTKGTPTGKATGPLKPGEYWWSPKVSPSGPVVVLVSIPLQQMHVYRNGILVGRSSVSTGSKGHDTPTGVFTILEKKQTHRSKKYDDAPMPNMQRLTWSGIAMHSGNLPGYPASHGCVRMPYDFSTLLFSITGNGGTVIIGDAKTQPRFAANPGLLLAPTDFKPEMLKSLAKGEYQWEPERSTSGPITMMVSAAGRTVYVYRNGEPIGRAAIEVKGRLGSHVFTMLEGVTAKESVFVPGSPGRNWMSVSSGGDFAGVAKRVRISPEFAAKVYEALKPGATIIVTDEPVVRKQNKDFTILAD
ncbi:MAG TPA: L,D-transpeptidase [Chthoniobacterales bacterium]|nr:L,D-transpeptidase [Chthoniobacterales bacterium]